MLSYTDHVPLEAIYKELSRHESNSQQAIIMEQGVVSITGLHSGGREDTRFKDEVRELSTGHRVKDLVSHVSSLFQSSRGVNGGMN